MIVNQVVLNRNVLKCFFKTESDLYSKIFAGRLFQASNRCRVTK